MGTVKNTRHRESAIRRAQPLPFDIEVMLVPSCILGPEGCANAGFDQTCVGFAVGAGGAPTAWSGPQGKMASSGGGHSSTKSLAEDQTCRSVRYLVEFPSCCASGPKQAAEWVTAPARKAGRDR